MPDLGKSTQQLAALVQSVKDYSVFMLDENGIVRTWNDGARIAKGYEAHEIIGQHFSRFYTPEEAAAGRPRMLLDQALRDGRVEDEGWRVRKDGKRFWADVVITPVRDETGALIGFVKVTRDLTARRESEQALRTSEQRMRLLVDGIRDHAVIGLDANGLVETWNEGARRIKGYTAAEIVGRPSSTFYTPEDVATDRPGRLLRKAAAEGRSEDEGWRVRKDGTRFWANVVVGSVRDSAGNLVGFSKITRDLTERRETSERLRQSEDKFRLLVDSVQDYAIFMLDPAGRVATWNAGAERIKGYTAGEIIGRHFSAFYEADAIAAGKCELELAAAVRDGRVEDEGWRVRKDGTRFWASVVLTALRDATGELVGFAKVTRDMTDQITLEQERIRTAKAEESVRLRDEFLSIASHELKTPLTALQLQLETLAMRIENIDSRLASKVDAATESGRRLATLVETLLDVSRIATARLVLDREPLDLAALVRQVGERVHHAATAAHCDLVIDVPDTLSGTWDRTRVEQILMNLLSNALKYGRGEQVDVSLRREDDAAVLTVRDRGPGIEPQDLERIFGRFERAASLRHYGGFGLGLFITREIVEAHGGTIAATNASDGGAEFTVRLPLDVVAPVAVSSAPSRELQ